MGGFAVIDQASRLRELVAGEDGREIEIPCPSSRIGCTVIAVTSGKGGVGKTTVAVNLALVLAESGKSVLLVDADLGLANVDVMLGLGIVELACTIIYLIPKTSVLGAILLTGYLGGATATHVRIGELAQAIAPVVFGVLVWLGIYLRCGRLRAILPIRT